MAVGLRVPPAQFLCGNMNWKLHIHWGVCWTIFNPSPL